MTKLLGHFGFPNGNETAGRTRDHHIAFGGHSNICHKSEGIYNNNKKKRKRRE